MVLQPLKSGFNTVRLMQVPTHCFSRQTHGATLGHIFFVFLKPKVCQTVESPLGLSGKFAHGRSLGTSLGQIFPDNPFRLSTVCTTLLMVVGSKIQLHSTYVLFSDEWKQLSVPAFSDAPTTHKRVLLTD